MTDLLAMRQAALPRTRNGGRAHHDSCLVLRPSVRVSQLLVQSHQRGAEKPPRDQRLHPAMDLLYVGSKRLDSLVDSTRLHESTLLIVLLAVRTNP